MYQLGQARCTRYNSSVIKFVSDLRQVGGFLLVHRHPFLQITVAEPSHGLFSLKCCSVQKHRNQLLTRGRLQRINGFSGLFEHYCSV